MKVHKTNDGGDTWVDGSGTGLPECTGVRGAAILADRSDPEIAYVLWSGFYPGQADSEDLEIYNGAARTTNGGDTWEDAGTWGNTMSFVEIQMAQHPTLGTIMAAFAEDDQYMNVCRFSRSVNEGSSWMDHELLAGPLEDRWLRLYGLEYTDSGTLVAMLGSTIEAGMGFEPAYWYAKRSTTNGFIWSPLIQINTDEDGWFNYGGAIEPTGGDTLYAVWYDGYDQLYSVSTDAGATWAENMDTGGRNGTAYGHRLAANASKTHLMMTVEMGDNVWHQTFDGTSWGQQSRLNNRVDAATDHAELVSDSGNVFVAVWPRGARYGAPKQALVTASSKPSDSKDVAIRLNETLVGYYEKVKRGDEIRIEYHVTNYTAEEQTVDLWLTYLGQDNPITGTMRLWEDEVFAPEESRSYMYEGTVHRRAPYQFYDVAVHAGKATADVWRSDVFEAQVKN